MPLSLSGTDGVSKASASSIDTAALQNGAVTPAKLSGAQSGSAPVYGARAWCVFDGTLAGTNAPLAGGNVTSVQRTATGKYLITFTTAMPDANYCASLSARNTSSVNVQGVVAEMGGGYGTAVRTTTQLAIVVMDGTAGAIDSSFISVAIFR